MQQETPADANALAFDRIVAELRPRLHRYLARMTGSVIDGEDVLQETLLKALQALPPIETLISPQAWLFRIAHNAAQDFLRRRQRQTAIFADEDIEMIASSDPTVPSREAAAASLRTFMRLPPAQRSAVILRDVLGHSMNEIAEVTGNSALAVKAALQRGRIRLKELAGEPEDAMPPALDAKTKARLTAYIHHFNERDFDAVRAMLIDDVKLDLVNRLTSRGKRVGEYYTRYSQATDWHCALGLVDGEGAILMFDPQDPDGPPSYFTLLDWAEDGVALIRDFRFARYAMENAQITRLE